MGPKILIAIIWLTCFAVLFGLFQVHGVGAFAILLIGVSVLIGLHIFFRVKCLLKFAL